MLSGASVFPSQKGRVAFFAGKPRSACPYCVGGQTAWHDGYDHAFREAVTLIPSGKSISIGLSKIRNDGQWLCATDAYGCDRYFGETTKDSVKTAIAWVIDVESSPCGEHPAEKNSTGVINQ